MVNFKLHLYFPGWVGVGVVIIKLKANLSATGLDLDWTGTELGKIFQYLLVICQLMSKEVK